MNNDLDPKSFPILQLSLKIPPTVAREAARWRVPTPKVLFTGWVLDLPTIVLVFDGKAIAERWEPDHNIRQELDNFAEILQQELGFFPEGLHLNVRWQLFDYSGPHLIVC